MEQIKLAGELSMDQGNDVATSETSRNAKDLRTLNDLELVWVGGGDGAPVWP